MEARWRATADDNGGLFSDNAMIKADSVLYRPVNGEIRLQDG